MSELNQTRNALLWVRDVYRLVRQNKIDTAIDVLYDRFDDFLRNGQFAQAHEALVAINLNLLDSNLMIALLTITLAAKEQLPHRAEIVVRIERILKTQMSEERADELLKGLR